MIRKTHLEKLPKVVRIEPSAVCNLRCRYCPTGTNPMRNNPGIMRMDTFKKIIQEIKRVGTVKVAVLYHGGEPFLNKEFFQMVKTLKENGVEFVKTVTNGMLLEYDDLKKIIEEGLDSIEFSLDGLSPEENNKIRVGSDYHKVIEKIKKLIELKKKKGKNLPEICISNIQIPTVAMIKNNTPIRPPEYILGDLGELRDEVKFKCFYTIKWPGFNLGDTYKLEKMPQSSEEARECDHVISTMTIRANGDVVPCCYDLSSQYVIGNILEQKLEEIWNNEKYQLLRKSIVEGNYLPLCQNCFVVKPQLYLCKADKE